MIKIEEINKENDNNYFVVYNINKNIHTYGGTAEEIMEYFNKVTKEINDK
jgi:hypothetical protein